MAQVKGTYGTARIFTDTVEENALEQIRLLCNQEFVKGARIRIMPDVHAGAGCVIGFTADLGDLVIPYIVGVDIGCGMLTVELGKEPPDFEKLDAVIRAKVPSGTHIHDGRVVRFPALQSLYCYRDLKDARRLERSLGTLGGGNHFIEVDRDEEGTYYLVIHTGSRNLGKQVAEYYQSLAYDLLCGMDALYETQKRLIREYKAAGRRKELSDVLKELRRTFQPKEPELPKELCYLTGEYREHYLMDMKLCQEYACLNRKAIASAILTNLLDAQPSAFSMFETVHNYIDLENNMIRKGAVSAKVGERLIIPINMRDGSLICVGKGNADWNCSAPHGAGRLYSRTAAKQAFTVEEYAREMRGVYSTSVSSGTLDECPMAYKSMEEIAGRIGPTADVLQVLRPVYNFKAGS